MASFLLSFLQLFFALAAMATRPMVGPSHSGSFEGKRGREMKQLIICALTVALTPCLFEQNMSPSDRKFVEKAAMGGKAEVELGNLALQKASDSKVKQF